MTSNEVKSCDGFCCTFNEAAGSLDVTATAKFFADGSDIHGTCGTHGNLKDIGISFLEGNADFCSFDLQRKSCQTIEVERV